MVPCGVRCEQTRTKVVFIGSDGVGLRMRIMDCQIVEARYVTGHTVWLRFRDGTSGEIDLSTALRGPVFEPLRNPEVFSQFQIHPEFHTLVWPNGADLAPEFLRDQLRVTA